MLCIKKLKMFIHFIASPVSGSVVKNLPANVGDTATRVRSLDPKDPLEEEMAMHSSILAWRIPGTGKPGGLECMRSQRARHGLAQYSSSYS